MHLLPTVGDEGTVFSGCLSSLSISLRLSLIEVWTQSECFQTENEIKKVCKRLQSVIVGTRNNLYYNLEVRTASSWLEKIMLKWLHNVHSHTRHRTCADLQQINMSYLCSKSLLLSTTFTSAAVGGPCNFWPFNNSSSNCSIVWQSKNGIVKTCNPTIRQLKFTEITYCIVLYCIPLLYKLTECNLYCIQIALPTWCKVHVFGHIDRTYYKYYTCSRYQA